MRNTALLLTAMFCSAQFVSAQLVPTYDNVMIPMRDNETLEADIYIPAGVDSGEVILIQTPYNKDNFSNSLPLGVDLNLDAQPFIWVIVDWRGFYGSSGADISNFERGEDGYDICEWIVDQVWHKDRIGTWGPSALGSVQYATMREQHPNHTCAVPLVAHPQQSYDSYFFGGVLEEERLNTLDLLGYGLSPVIMANTYYNLTWQFAESNTWYPGDIQIPTLQIGGWYDHNIDKMMLWYEATRNSAFPAVQDEQWLLVGPWVHGGSGAAYVGSSVQGELNYPNAEFVSDTMAWEFFEYYLLDTPNGWDNTDLVTYYEMGFDQWNSTNDVSISSPALNAIYLNEANSIKNSTGTTSTSFISDPSNPAPTIGGQTLSLTLDQGPYNQISLESRNDIITFETVDLTENLSISGRVGLSLYVESDQPDCDIAVQLVDVYPDGRNMLITEGIQRMRFRNGYWQADEEFMIPGQVYLANFDLPFTNYTWLTGHKIKLYIGGNSSTRFHVNQQDGGPMYTSISGNVANIVIHHNSTYPSSMSLPGNTPILETKELSLDGFEIYPNPVHDILRIEGEGQFNYAVKDIKGRTLRRGTGNQIQSVQLSNLHSGSYIIEIQNDQTHYKRKFIKL